MATNDFQPFAYSGSANVISQSAYLALTSLLQNGFSSGVAQSNQLNKVWRQSSIMAAVLAQFASDYSGNNSTDDGTTATLEANLVAAIRSATKTGVILADTGVANAYTAVNVPPLTSGTWVDAVVQQVKIAHANTGASTYAPDGLTAIPIYGLGLQPLQGGELALNGTAVLMHATIAGVNSGNPIAVLMECFGGAQQVAPATQSNHAIQAGQAAGIVGSSRNAKMNIAAAGTTATFTADELVVESGLGGIRYCLSSLNLSVNLATTGAGGMDTGTAPASGWVGIYAIYNPATKTAALLAQATANPSEIYTGANMPAGYTASALVAVWLTNISKQFTTGVLNGRKVSVAASLQLSQGSVVSTWTALSIAGVVPLNAKRVFGYGNIQQSTNGTLNLLIAADSNGSGQAEISVGTAASGNINSAAGSFSVDIGPNAATVYYQNQYSGSGTITSSLYVTGYEF